MTETPIRSAANCCRDCTVKTAPIRRRPSPAARGTQALALIALGVLISITPVRGQTTGSRLSDVPALAPPPVNLPNETDADLSLPAVPDGYKVGPDDLLSVIVYKMPDLSRQVRVADDGTIRLPLLAQPLLANGKTAHQIGNEVAQALVSQQLAVDPTVMVTVRQVLSRPIVVSGAVKSPMVIQASRPMRLLEVLSRAGGLGDTAGTTVLLTRATPVGTMTETINLTKLTETTDSNQDPMLQGGDVIRVLPARMVYAVGAFQKPGAFPVRPGQPITVLEAIALAEGFSPTVPADKSHAEIIRSAANGGHVEIPVNINKMLKRKLPDQVLEAGDVLYVPENGRRKALTTALNDASQLLIIGLGYNAHIF